MRLHSWELWLIFLTICRFATKAHFTYDPNDSHGPSNWGKHFPACAGNRQSPINIKTSSAISKTFETPLTFYDYSTKPLNMSTVNNGHTAKTKFDYARNHTPRITGGPLSKDFYYLSNVHCHWGHHASEGSEHTINGTAFAMECHIVHGNIKYHSLDEALSASDGIAVIAILYKEEPTGSTNLTIIDEMTKATNQDQVVEAKDSVNLIEGLGLALTGPYYTYKGSLTTPGCAEAVTWIVLSQQVAISPKQMGKLRQIKDLSGNFRPIQELKGRDLFISKAVGNEYMKFGVMAP